MPVIGYIVVLFSVIAGHFFSGGVASDFWQPTEMLMIILAASGAYITGNNEKIISSTVRSVCHVFHKKNYNLKLTTQLADLLLHLLKKARFNGLLSLDEDVTNPDKSDFFTDYPLINANPLIMGFITDCIRLRLIATIDHYDLESILESQINTFKEEGETNERSLILFADSLPAFGIISAVLGVIHTLSDASRPATELSILVAQAMVGTFTGILLCYGIVTPLASRIRQKNVDHYNVLQCIKKIMIADAAGVPPEISVEIGRKKLFTDMRYEKDIKE